MYIGRHNCDEIPLGHMILRMKEQIQRPRQGWFEWCNAPLDFEKSHFEPLDFFHPIHRGFEISMYALACRKICTTRFEFAEGALTKNAHGNFHKLFIWGENFKNYS